jgi:hypothetical protein
MASVVINKLGTTPLTVTSINIRADFEDSTVNRYVSGTIPGTLTFDSIDSGVDVTYIVTVTTKDCGIITKNFKLKEVCKSTPSVVLKEECLSTPTLKIRSSLSNETNVRIRIYQGDTLLQNKVVQGGIDTSFTGLPLNKSLRIVAEHPDFPACKTEIAHTLSCSCSFTISATNPQSNHSTPEPEPSGEVLYISKTDYATRNVDLWDQLGYYQNEYESGQTIIDWIGGWVGSVFTYKNANQKLSNLGFPKVGIYTRNIPEEYGDNTEYYNREKPENRYLYQPQQIYEQTNPEMPEYFKDLAPGITGAPFVLDSGETWDPRKENVEERRKWNVAYAWSHRYTAPNDPQNVGNFWAMVRYNNEGHPESTNDPWYVKCRYYWQDGMYRPARVGGNNKNKTTGESKLPSEPDFSKMSDAEWSQYFRQCVVNYAVWVYGKAKDNGVQPIGYDLDTKAGFMQELASPGSQWPDVRGYRKEILWHGFSSTDNGRKLGDVLQASNYGWLDVLFKPSPVQLLFRDKTYTSEGTTYMEYADLGLAENTTPTNVITEGEPEFYRFVVNRNNGTCPSGSSVTIRFEDREGNLRKTTQVIRAESATDDYRVGQQTQTVVDIPVGTTSFTYCHHVPLGERWTSYSLDDFTDERLLIDWEYANYNYVSNNGKPFNYQVYMHSLADRYPNLANETTNAGQLPKNLCYGFKFLAYTFHINHVLYTPTGYTGVISLQNFSAANKIVKELEETHFQNGEVIWVPIEVSLDNGITWTDSNPIIRRTDIVPTEADAFFTLSPNGYGSAWVSKRRKQNSISPMTLVTYNTVQKSYAIFEKAMFGDVLNYSFRVKENNGQYRYFNNRFLDRSWKTELVTSVE